MTDGPDRTRFLDPVYLFLGRTRTRTRRTRLLPTLSISYGAAGLLSAIQLEVLAHCDFSVEGKPTFSSRILPRASVPSSQAKCTIGDCLGKSDPPSLPPPPGIAQILLSDLLKKGFATSRTYEVGDHVELSMKVLSYESKNWNPKRTEESLSRD